jgi:hypothetical protein
LKRVTNATRSRLDIEKKKKEKESKIKKSPIAKKSDPNPLNSQIWEAYKDAYILRYGVEPTRNITVNAQISQIAKRLGTDSIEVVKFYLKHNESFYVKNLHAIGHCLSNSESLHTQWKRNQPITSNMVRQLDKSLATSDLIRDIQENGI